MILITFYYSELFNRAACKIENAWISYKNRRLFKLLKNSICAAVCQILDCFFKYLNILIVMRM